jgi:putative hydrolase of HD superfamily
MNSLSLLEFCKLIGKLKHLKRTGWVLRDIIEPETVASHMYRMALLTFALKPEEGIDQVKCMKMSLVHDLAESIVGDITPHCGVTEDDKHEREKKAICDIAELLPEVSGEEIIKLFMEYENQRTLEAKLVKDFDKFDMIMQAYEYETSKCELGKLEEFFTSTRGKFTNDQVKEWVKALEDERNKNIKKLNTQ